MKLTIIGSGYVGLVTGVCFASMGHEVICADTASEKMAILESGGLPLFEEELEPLLREALNSGRIRFTTNMAFSIEQSDILFITVGTPSRSDGEADLTQLWSVVNLVAQYSNGKKLLVIKSTIPVGTSDSVEAVLQNSIHAHDRIIDVVHNPEFLRQGNAVHDFFHPDRIVVGCKTEEARKIMNDLYGNISSPIYFCNRRSAELIKYSSNAFLAMKISFINMMANLSDKLGVNVDEVAKGLGADRRIGAHFLQSGIGYGGSCFPKDIKALQALGKAVACELPLIDSTERINTRQPQIIVNKLKTAMKTLQGARIALLGLTFKPMTDDIREAPSLAISRMCLAEGATVHAYDPLIRNYPIKEVILHNDLYTAIDSCDAIIILTEWDEFRLLDWNKISRKLRSGLIVDGRNMFSWSEMKNITENYGITYLSIGRPALYGGSKMDANEPASSTT